MQCAAASPWSLPIEPTGFASELRPGYLRGSPLCPPCVQWALALESLTGSRAELGSPRVTVSVACIYSWLVAGMIEHSAPARMSTGLLLHSTPLACVY
jgi:hypothetical protein